MKSDDTNRCYCTHCTVKWSPVTVMVPNPLTGEQQEGKSDRWVCTDCGHRFLPECVPVAQKPYNRVKEAIITCSLMTLGAAIVWVYMLIKHGGW